ncbi:hypothetical protein IAU60_000203 [Kwoniella sp. DSM 27419]
MSAYYVAWSCSNSGISENQMDKCCYTNSTCASYVCDTLNANITVTNEQGVPTIYSCFVNASRAMQIEGDAPNLACNGTSKGCLLYNTPNATTNATMNGTTSMTNGTGGAGGSSAAMARLNILHESWVLGAVVMYMVLRRVF